MQKNTNGLVSWDCPQTAINMQKVIEIYYPKVKVLTIKNQKP